MTPASRFSSETTGEAKPTPPAEEKPAVNFRYTMSQTRSSVAERPSMAGDVNFAHKQSARAAIEQQNLQPSMLPAYYQPNMDRSVLVDPEPDPSESVRISHAQASNQRRFQVSKTCANAILPLKSVKLANPFPEPVKMMMSRTVSDEEKAEQMLADSRSQRHMSDWARGTPGNFRSFSTDVKRWYSSASDDKCKLGKPKEQKKAACPKMRLKGCQPVARQKCERIAHDPNCKKQEAPYPAYSEFCHEDPDMKPSECRLCPWSVEDNPNFKPQKKKFHSSTSVNLRRRGLEMEESEIEPSQMAETQEPQETTAVFEEQQETPLEGMLCDMRKPDCEQPKGNQCPPGTTKAEREKKNKPEKKNKKDDKSKKAASESTLASLFNRPLLPTETQPIFSLKKSDDEDSGPQPCKIKKFKFPPCQQVKKVDEEVKEKCPKKKKKRQIRDCPGSSDGKKCEDLEQVIEYRLMANKQGDDKSKDCPRIDKSTDPDAMQDRCQRKRQGITEICPSGGVLKKKKKRGSKDNKKEASELIPPVEPEPDHPQRPQPTLRRI